MSTTPAEPWRPTALHRTAIGAAFVLLVLAVVVHRPDLVVVATPLLVVAVWGWVARPASSPQVAVVPPAGDLAEGQGAPVRFVATGLRGADTVAGELGADPSLRVHPAGHVAAVDDDRHEATVTVQPTRWGPAWIGTGETHLRSAWGAYDARWRRLTPLPLVVTPTAGRFDADAPVPNPSTLLGAHVSRRRGEGSEFDAIREFRPGDRPRQVHWATSARTGRLHVRSNHAENDAQIMVLVDAFGDLPGLPDGSLTRSVRAAASVVAWATGTGDRVGLVVPGAGVPSLPPASGRAQLARALGTLGRVVPATDRSPDDVRLRLAFPPGTLVVVVSPLTARWMVSTVAELAGRGHDVVVIDPTPERVHLEDPAEALAARILELERERTIGALAHRGVAVTAWRGPGTLDAVLVGLARRRGGAR